MPSFNLFNLYFVIEVKRNNYFLSCNATPSLHFEIIYGRTARDIVNKNKALVVSRIDFSDSNFAVVKLSNNY